MDYPQLDRSYKNRYPFRLATSSFIYPDSWTVNAKRLGPYLDEIELLFLESDNLPSRDVIDELAAVSERYQLTYNVHLPTDIDPAAPDVTRRQAAVDVIHRVRKLTAPLKPTSYTLHPAVDPAAKGSEEINAWRHRLIDSLKRVIADGLPARQIALETLNTPFEWAAAVVDALDLSVCLDIGHRLVAHRPIGPFFDRYERRLPIIHLHGVDETKDHLSLDRLPADTLTAIVRMLRRYDGTVSLEVFSFDHLRSSLATLEHCWREVERN